MQKYSRNKRYSIKNLGLRVREKCPTSIMTQNQFTDQTKFNMTIPINFHLCVTYRKSTELRIHSFALSLAQNSYVVVPAASLLNQELIALQWTQTVLKGSSKMVLSIIFTV